MTTAQPEVQEGGGNEIFATVLGIIYFDDPAQVPANLPVLENYAHLGEILPGDYSDEHLAAFAGVLVDLHHALRFVEYLYGLAEKKLIGQSALQGQGIARVEISCGHNNEAEFIFYDGAWHYQFSDDHLDYLVGHA